MALLALIQLLLLLLRRVSAFQVAGHRSLLLRARPLGGALEDGDAFLAEAVAALRETRLAAAREGVSRARAEYARVDDAAVRADREALAASVDAPAAAALEKARSARAAALARARARGGAAADTAGDALTREAVAALARKDYGAARAKVDDARAAFARDGVADREPALGNLFASINAEQEREAKAAVRREKDRADAADAAAARGRELVAEQRIAAAEEGGS